MNNARGTNLLLTSKQQLIATTTCIGLFLLLLVTLKPSAAFIDDFANLTGVNISAVYPLNFSLLRGIVDFNVSVCISCSRGNVTNITIYLVNRTGSFFVLGINTTQNASFYVFRNDTTVFNDGAEYRFNITIANQSGFALSSIEVGNFSIDNTAPNVTLLSATSNQTNTRTYFNFTMIERGNGTLLNCSLTVDGVIVNNTNFTTAQNAANNTAQNMNYTTIQGEHNALVTCYDTARERNQFGGLGNAGTTARRLFTVDVAFPGVTIKFQDKDNNEGSEFEFGAEVTAVCNLSDAVAVRDSTINLSTILPNAGIQNVTPATQSKTEATYKFIAEDTRTLGTYFFSCGVMDYLSQLNNTVNATFTIKTQVRRGTSAYSIPGFKEPIAKKIIGEGIVNAIGELTETGEARLIDKTGGVIVNLDGQDYEIIVKEVSENTVTLDVAGTESQINAGESKQYDPDSDNTNELEITLNMIYHGKADLIFKKISVQVAPSAEERKEEVTEKVPEQVVVEKRGIKSLTSVMLVIIIVVVLIAAFMIMMAKRRGGDGQIKFKPRDLGMRKDQSEEFYTQTAGPSDAKSPPPFPQ